jgi:histidine triad (HIT) family protein
MLILRDILELDMSSLFTKIINGEIPCHKITENDSFFSFLDINPIEKGHTLVVPKIEVDVFFELDNSILSEILVFAKPIASAIKKTINCNRVGVIIAGLEVPHAHIHLVPITSTSELNFANARSVEQETLAKTAKEIRAYL